MNNKIALWSITLLSIALIFYFSAEPGSSSQARTFKIAKLVDREGNKFPEMNFGKLHYYIRKVAHFTEYFVLAVLISFAFHKKRRRPIKHFIIVLHLSIFIALIDEWIQTFTPGRSGQLMDILIDGIGALLGTIAYFISCKLLNKFMLLYRKHNRACKKKAA